MDARLDWKASADVEPLVDAVIACRQQLVTHCVLKHGMRTKALSCDAYASARIVEFFRLSSRWIDSVDASEEDLTVPTWRRQKKLTELVADFSAFRLHVSPDHMGDDVRVLMSFDVGDAAMQAWFGTVSVVAQ